MRNDRNSSGAWRRRAQRWLVTVAALVALPGAAPAQATVERWLVLGPTRVTTPFGGVTSDSALLGAMRLRTDDAWPAEGASVPLPDGSTLRWQPGDGAVPAGSLVHAAAYVTGDRWQRVTLAFPGDTGGARRVWVDGRRIPGTSVDLARGTHAIVVQRLARADRALAPLRLVLTPAAPGGTLAASLDPRHAPGFRELFGTRAIGEIALAPGAARLAMVLRGTDRESDRTTSWLEVRDAASGRTLAELRSGSPASPMWSGDGRRLAFVTSTDRAEAQGRDLWTWDANTGAATRLLRAESVSRIVGWSPDAAWLYYMGTERAAPPPAPKPGDVRRLTEVWQRGQDSPDRVQLFALHVANGTRSTLVADTVAGVTGARLSPDGKTIVFSRGVYARDARPWLRAELWALDLATLGTRRLLELQHEAFTAPGAFAFSPDSRAIAFCASVKERGTGEGATTSAFEIELYATSLERPALVHLSAGYEPSLGPGLGCSRLAWSRDGRIHAPVDAGARTLLARTRRAVTSALEPTTLETVPLEEQTMTSFDLAEGVMVAAVEGPVTPPYVVRVELGTGATRAIARPNADALANVTMPSWRPWSFRNTRGEQIESWYWLPPAFDSTAKHPLIVFYYGGTLPMKKNFEQRLLWFAANGYVVLMMNPAGTPGYGQRFSDYHTNDWGFPAATDVLEGTQQFLAAHRFVDATRVGNFGHSYGGFMTMHLLTRSELFRTGISLAGISNIANYWGAGNTGYSYTEGTCPGCYPWNRKDIFIDRSPLFAADRVKVPLLLIHGTGDTNVVPSESEQMFTALRMLGREVELVRIQGENHGINSRPSVVEARDGMMLDWFEKYLRDRPEAWAARWK